jgi:uncharacterized protein (TIGR00290 family)
MKGELMEFNDAQTANIPKKAILAWSGGKDSTMALYEVKRANSLEISALLTTLTEGYDRISMHGVRRIFLEKQAASLGMLLEKVFIPINSTNEIYETRMNEKLLEYKNKGITTTVFGDIFLEDLRKYREENLSKINMHGIFPLWKNDTAKLGEKFIDLGFKAVVTCIDSHALDKEFAGREYNKQFLKDLPSKVDPCGENGEFHTFVYDGPIFRKAVNYKLGEITLRENRFYFCDLVPV